MGPAGSTRGVLFRARASILFVGVMAALGFLPLFAGPGYEHTLATGLVLPSFVTVVSAGRAARHVTAPLYHLLRAYRFAIALSLLSYATALVHGLRVGLCDPLSAAVPYLLGPTLGAMLAAGFGTAVGTLARKQKPWIRVLLSLGLPLASALVSVWRFYKTPMIFALDPFVGYFSGTLYDTVVEPGSLLLTYRVGSLGTLLFVSSFAALWVEGDQERLVVRESGSLRTLLVALACLGLLGSLSVMATATQLGHVSTTASIRHELGGNLVGARCDVVFPDSVSEREARLLLQDCEEELGAVERFFGVRGPERLVAIFFRDAEEKRRLMGAMDTYIAKPWRGEVYLQMAPYPHPVLGHEIAHVVAGSFGAGPFRIAGSYGGLLPNPGLIEGAAVAASPDDDALTGREWAAAMHRLGILPKVDDIFGLAFLGGASSKSYAVAGAFVTFVIEKYGTPRFRRWYGGASVAEVYGKPLSELEREFVALLEVVTLSADVLDFARARFDKPGVFHRRCPHAVDRERKAGDKCRDAGRFEAAKAAYERAIAWDPKHADTRLSRLSVDLKTGDEASKAQARRAISEMANDSATRRTVRDRARELLADDLALSLKPSEARDLYLDLAARSLDEDAARTFEVKARLLETPLLSEVLFALLLGRGGRAPDGFSGPLLLGKRLGDEPILAYLAARNLAQRGLHREAEPLFVRALSLSPESPRILREIFRKRAEGACAERDLSLVERLRREVLGEGSPFDVAAHGRRAHLVGLLERCGAN